MDADKLKEIADGMSAAVRGYVARALAPISTRLATVETRTGALSMIAGRGSAAENNVEFDALQSTQRDLQARLAKSDALVVSLEARASRHAEHLRALESRLKVLEHK